MELSIVVPVYNEEENIAPLYLAIHDAVADLGLQYELLLIDDGSSDNTFAIAAALARSHTEVRVIRFRKNYGQTPAMAAGIDLARGDVILTMDGDLQNDPADIPRFLEKINEGYDIVVGWRHDRKDKLVTRKIPSRIANWLIGRVTGVYIKDNGCSLKAFRADLIKRVPLYSDMHRFIPAMASLAGPKIAQIKVRHHARKFGESKYGLSRIYKVLLDLLTVKTIVEFSSKPLVWFVLLSIPAIFVSVVALTLSVYQVIGFGNRFSTPIAGTGVLFGALSLFLIMTGVLAELIYKTADTRVKNFFVLTAQRLKAESRNITTQIRDETE